MANLFKRDRSPFWWVKYKDHTGKIHRESTGMRIDVKAETRRAQEIRALKALEEFKAAPESATRFEHWVRPFLQGRYERGRNSLERYLGIWRTLEVFLTEKQIVSADQVKREHAFQYIDWRSVPHEGVRAARRNTAILEIKVLSMILKEGVQRGMAPFNPLVGLGIKRATAKVKPELSEADLQAVEDMIDLEPEPLRTILRNSWLIARWQGCRITETQLDPQDDIHVSRLPDGAEQWTVRFRAKGGRDHIAPVAPKLIPLFRELRAKGARQTYPLVSQRRTKLSSVWQKFFARTGLKESIPGITFHCLRVTAATRMARANVPEAKAMRLLGHASSTVHRVYQRLRHSDLADCFDALEGPSSSKTGSSSGTPSQPKNTPDATP